MLVERNVKTNNESRSYDRAVIFVPGLTGHFGSTGTIPELLA
jgi:hypothetical protein